MQYSVTGVTISFPQLYSFKQLYIRFEQHYIQMF